MHDKRFLTPDEIAVMQMALQCLIEDTEDGMKDKRFSNEAYLSLREILGNAKSALGKIQVMSGQAFKMDPYKPGDEDEFLKT